MLSASDFRPKAGELAPFDVAQDKLVFTDLSLTAEIAGIAEKKYIIFAYSFIIPTNTLFSLISACSAVKEKIGFVFLLSSQRLWGNRFDTSERKDHISVYSQPFSPVLFPFTR